MNTLNSILIEGNVVATPEKCETVHGNTICNFKIVNSRFEYYDGTLEKDDSIFDIEAYGKHAKECIESCTEGRGVRVVGRLKRYEDGSVKIVADHVEFKPQYTHLID